MIENMVKILNELLEADPKAADGFFRLGIDVNKQVCDHPTIQVLMDSDQSDTGVLRPLGLLNGLLEGDRVIVMMMDDAGEITGFTAGTLTDGKVTPDAAGD